MSTLPSSVGLNLAAVDSAVRSIGRQLAERYPALESTLLHLRDVYARAFVWTTVQANRVVYDAPIEPYRLLEVDPDRIEYVCQLRDSKFRHAGVVTGGDWDRTDTRFEDLDVYRAYEQHFLEGRPWAETAFYERIVDELRAGNVKWGCRTPAEFEARCERLDALYEFIASHGYRTQNELLAADVSDPIKPQNRLKTERLKDEIAVHIGRDGELLFADGRNRLSIVKLLDLETIPVRVLRRHERWQAVRDAYVTGEPRVAGCDHPDLRPFAFASKRE